MSLKNTIRNYLRDVVTALDRAPAELALAIFAAATVSYAFETGTFEGWVKLAIAIFLTFAFAWTGTLLHAFAAIGSTQRRVLTVAGAGCGIAYLLFSGDIAREAEGWRAWLLIAAAVLLMLAAPAWADIEGDPSLRLRRINARILLRTIGITLYGLALFAGLALALAAIEKLFELKLDGEIYGHVFAWIMLVLVPWVIVGGLEDYTRPLDEVSDVARVAFRLISFLVPPLVVLYFLILFVYAIRILITGELPKNLVSPMVLAAGLLTALAAVLFDPAPGDSRTGPRILRAAPVFFIPLVPLGFWALFLRIDEYGWTEFRLLRVLLLLLLLALAVAAVVQVVRRRAFQIRVIPLLLGISFALAAAGPWSVLALARRDQQQRLRAALHEAQVDPTALIAGDTTRLRTVPRDVYDRINDVGWYLYHHFGPDALPAAVPPDMMDRGRGLADYLALAPAAGADSLPAFVHASLPTNVAVRTGQGTVYRVHIMNRPMQAMREPLVLDVAGGLQVRIDSVLPRPSYSRERPRGQRLAAVALPVTDARGTRRGELIVFEASVQQRRDSMQIQQLDGVVILR